VRDLRALEPYRNRKAERALYGCDGNEGNGVFTMPSPIDRAEMAIVASDGGGWDHVSVSRGNRCPNWIELDYVKRAFFRDEECAMQLHPAVAKHISLHPYTLHLWRPQNIEIPLPPSKMV
jgi:hypothetical protein